jgi:hypothetical protein
MISVGRLCAIWSALTFQKPSPSQSRAQKHSIFERYNIISGRDVCEAGRSAEKYLKELWGNCGESPSKDQNATGDKIN